MSDRRSFLASAAAIMVAAGVNVPVAAQARDERGAAYGAPLGHPDGGLLALCAEFHRANADVQALLHGDADMTDAMQARYAISDRIIDLAPQTAKGAREMVRVAMVMMEENERDNELDADVRFAVAALRGVIGSGFGRAAGHIQDEDVATTAGPSLAGVRT